VGGDPLLVVAGADLGAPFEVGEVPGDGELEAGGPGFGGPPAKVAGDAEFGAGRWADGGFVVESEGGERWGWASACSRAREMVLFMILVDAKC